MYAKIEIYEWNYFILIFYNNNNHYCNRLQYKILSNYINILEVGYHNNAPKGGITRSDLLSSIHIIPA